MAGGLAKAQIRRTLAAIPNAGPYMEFSIERDDWTRPLYEPYLEVRDGQVAVPDSPGWGVRINQSWLDAASKGP